MDVVRSQNSLEVGASGIKGERTNKLVSSPPSLLTRHHQQRLRVSSSSAAKSGRWKSVRRGGRKQQASGCGGMDQATVKVVLRVKPKQGDRPTDSVTVVDNGENASVIVKKSPNSQELFQFDFLRALENASQEDVYKNCGQEIVESAVQGYNGTILAYGQTGSGKTYTMLGPNDALTGSHELQGIMPRAIAQVFQDLKAQSFLMWSVKLTFVEIYNEAFRDLLMPNVKEVTIQDTNQKGISNITLRGVTRVEVQSEDQAMGCLQKGQRSRAVSAHSMNDRSSRSHTILTLWIETTNKDGNTRRSKLNLVDLAGSERLRKTGAEGSIAKESTFINKSLSALSLVVKELKKKSAHVRYRDSKLTHYLKDSLGGNCQTLMIACMWGDSEHLGESISTCRFADDMQQVEVSAERNSGVETIHGHLFKLDPVMLKYIDCITAKRVAEEKTKLMLELRNKGRSTEVSEDSVDLTSGEHVELEALRARVKEFELQKVVKSRHGEFEVQGDAKEIEVLRQRVVELEKERDRVIQGTGPARHYSEAESLLLEEIITLRERVGDLQRAHSLSARDVEELKALRDRVQAMNVKDSEEAAANRPTKTQDAEGPSFSSARSKENLRGNPPASCNEDDREVERLRNRVKELEAKDVACNDYRQQFPEPMSKMNAMLQMPANANDRHSEVLKELKQMRDRLKALHNKTVEKLTKENVDELLEIKDRIITLQTEEARLREEALHAPKLNISLTEDSLMSPAASRATCSAQSVTSPKNKTDTVSVEEVEILRAENERMRRVLSGRSQSPVPCQSHRLDGCRCSSPVSPGMTHMSAPPRYAQACDSFQGSPEPGMVDPLIMSADASKHRVGLKKALSARFSKMMGRRKEGQFEDEFVSSENEEVPNIVILNSLTHDQLMELLRAHHETSESGAEYDEDPNNLMYGIEPATSPNQDIGPAMPLSPSRSDPAHSVSSQPSPSHHRSRSPKPRSAIDDMQGRSERPPIVPPLMLSRLP